MSTPIDHISLSCPHTKLEAYVTFLNAALEPFGIKELFRVMPEVVAFGPGMENPWLWVTALEDREKIGELDEENAERTRGRRVHLALRAKDRAQVQAFHEAAIKAGGKDNGAPGTRKEYHPGYYAAFVSDPAGHNLEAVIREKPAS